MCFYSELFLFTVFQFFQFITGEAAFPASGNRFSIECYLLLRVETDFLSKVLLFEANFVLVETIIQIKVKSFLIE